MNTHKYSPTAPSDPVTVYDALGRDRVSLGAWRLMVSELWEYRELIQRFVLRNFSAQFRQSLLGYLWVILPPVATTVVFALLRAAHVVNVPMPEGAMPYALFALVGTTLWGFFTQTTVMCTSAIANAGALVSKIYFPREVLVVSAAGNAVVNLVIRLAVVCLSFVLMGYTPHWQIVFVPFLLIPILVFALGLGLLMAPVNAMMNDISRAVEFFFQFGMFLAPTVYPTPSLSEVSTGWQEALYWVHTLNPVTHFMQAVNTLIEHGTFTPDLGMAGACLVCVLTLFLGWRFFHICEPFLAERL